MRPVVTDAIYRPTVALDYCFTPTV